MTHLAALVFALSTLPAPDAGCGIAVPGATTQVPVPPHGRPLLVRWPVNLDRSRTLPLVVLLHGSTASGEAMLRESGLGTAADRHGFIVAAPNGGIVAGAGFVWNIPGVPTVTGALPDRDAPDDVAYLRAAVTALASQGCVDRRRVYATGLSGGGRMASWLGCVAADRFAAIAPVVGLRAGRPSRLNPERPDPATCQPSRPMPVIAFAGGRDTTNPIAGGGAAYWRYSMHAAEQRWAEANGCTAAPTTRWIADGVYEERYAGCREGADVVARIQVDGGHSWVADNDVLWAFLSRFRRD